MLKSVLLATITKSSKNGLNENLSVGVQSTHELPVCLKYVELAPYDWLADREFADLSPLVAHVDTLIELTPQNDNDNEPSQTPQWKCNLKNQKPDSLPKALFTMIVAP